MRFVHRHWDLLINAMMREYQKQLQEMYSKFPYAVPTDGKRSEHYKLWDFKRSSHSWKEVGYSGAQESLESGKTLTPQNGWQVGTLTLLSEHLSINGEMDHKNNSEETTSKDGTPFD